MNTNATPSEAKTAAEEKNIRSVLLAAGAKGTQMHRALRGFDAYLVGFSCSKDMPKKQLETHHFCKQVNDDVLQCVIFDGDTSEARLLGVEYIISERRFAGLPDEERARWHPHNFEILGGQLVAPGLPAAAEKALLKLLMNSYGKHWHLWDIGIHTSAGVPVGLPLGAAHLMWSFNKDGQLDATLERKRNKRLEVSVEHKRREREDLIELANPQHGVETLSTAFGEPQRPYPGVTDARATGGAD